MSWRGVPRAANCFESASAVSAAGAAPPIAGSGSHGPPSSRASTRVSPAREPPVGESVIGVVISAIVVFSGVAAPLALVGAGFETAGRIIGGVAFAAIAVVLYRWILRMAAARST